MKNLFKFNVFRYAFMLLKQWIAEFTKTGLEMKHPQVNVKIDADNDICVIYNKFSIDSTLAAAVLKGRDFVGHVIDNTKVVPSTYKSYIWLGIEPILSPEGAFSNIIEKKHEIIIPTKDTLLDDDYTKSIFEIVCELCGVSHSGLGISINKFYTNKLTHEESVRLYANSIKAFDVLNGNTKESFTVLNYSPLQDVDFKTYMSGVKTKLKDGYGIQYIQVKDDTFVKTAVTCFNDDCFWALRLVKLAHKYYANIAVTLNGTLVETNIKNMGNIEMDSQIYNSKVM